MAPELTRTASKQISGPVEIVVSLNRCTGTAEIAEQYGAILAVEDEKNMARIRNTGVRSASGDIIATIDADSWMSPGMLKEIVSRIKSCEWFWR